MAAEVAWENIRKAAADKDMFDVKLAVQQYINACPDLTYVKLEAAFRSQEIGVFLIALEKPNMLTTMTNMDLQGNLDKKYTVNYRFSEKPNKPRERESWPSPEDNIVRLGDAGETVQRGLVKCNNCNELGHIKKNCPQDAVEVERVVVTCFNCEQTGHRVRDCQYSYVDK